jgi:ATP-dependent Clp protease ATP-binding subunit ClpA
MTSNLGASEMNRLMTGGIGFAPPSREEQADRIEHKIYRVAVDAAGRRFSPEFMNRLDKVIVFRPLNKADLQKILDIELSAVQSRIFQTQGDRPFVLTYTDKAKEFLLAEGTDVKYGARHLKRAIEHHLVLPLSSLLATAQIISGDTVDVDLADSGTELIFSRTNPVFCAVPAAATAVGASA